MSSSARQTHHRRRSHSASSPIPANSFVGGPCRPSFKRARPSSLRTPSYKEMSSDDTADRWRQGKRARRDTANSISNSRAPCLFGSSPVFRDDWASVPSSLSSTALPSTSDAFDLFPNRPKPNGASSHHPPPPHSARSSVSSDTSNADRDVEVSRLRSSAFWELQRSVVESGEGLVSRMRDWEEAHSMMKPGLSDQHPCDQQGRPQKRRMEWTDSIGDTFAEDDNEDDVQIIHSDALSECVPDNSLARHFPRRQRARSEGGMDVDVLESSSVCLGTDSAVPSNGSCLSSGYASDDDSSASLTYTSSTNSSRISLSLHHVNPMTTFQEHLSCPIPIVQSAASPSEKAIAALTLVMANGAGGINDYEAVRSLEAQRLDSLDESLVGELWN